jgi:hypothetical protein
MENLEKILNSWDSRSTIPIEETPAASGRFATMTQGQPNTTVIAVSAGGLTQWWSLVGGTGEGKAGPAIRKGKKTLADRLGRLPLPKQGS